MSEPKPPFKSDLLPPAGQVAADSFINLVGALARNEENPASYADVMAGLIYALPIIISMADTDEAMEAMRAKFSEYTSSEYFPTLVRQWAEYVKEVIAYHDSLHEGATNAIDLATDPRFN